MKRTATACLTLFVVVFFSFACIKTKNLSSVSKTPEQIPNPDYVGTFSSISIIKNEKEAVYNDSLTSFSNYIYDSVIRATVTKVKPVTTICAMQTPALKTLTEELVKVAIQSEKKNGLKVQPAMPLMDSVARLSDNRYSAYFINYGNSWTKKDYRKIQARNTALVSLAAVGIVMVAIIAGSGGSINNAVDLDGKDAKSKPAASAIPVDGVYCYLIIYDKQEKQVCFVRKQFYSTGKANNEPFHPKKINQQVTTIFKEYI